MLILSPLKIVWGTTVLVDETMCLDDESLNGSLGDLIQRVVCPGQAGGAQYNRGNRTVSFSLRVARCLPDYVGALEAQLNLLKTWPQNVANAVVTLWDFSAAGDAGALVAGKTWTLANCSVEVALSRCVSEWLYLEFRLTTTGIG